MSAEVNDHKHDKEVISLETSSSTAQQSFKLQSVYAELADVPLEVWKGWVELVLDANPLPFRILRNVAVFGVAWWAWKQPEIWAYGAVVLVIVVGSRLSTHRQMQRACEISGIDLRHAAVLRKDIRRHSRSLGWRAGSKRAELATLMHDQWKAE